ncbi:MAG: cytochrome c biogenesis protein CcdA [Vampirovibrionales bacterium]|nr:cytochrome c biogenesis protein CcdA [Vampirovibrionales bacterium]
MMTALETAFATALQSPNNVALLLGFSFVGGLISTLLPCSVAMVPILVGTIGTLGDSEHKGRLFLQIVLFIAGLSITLAAMGLAAGLLGQTLNGFGGPQGAIALKIAVGLLAFIIGLNVLEWIHLPVPQWLSRLPDSKSLSWMGVFAPLGLGLLFGIASSPCGTPFLAGILGLISQTHNVVLGGACLFVYGLGQGALLLLAGLVTGLMKHWAKVRHVGRVFTQLSGGVFVLLGLGMIADALGWLDAPARYLLGY